MDIFLKINDTYLTNPQVHALKICYASTYSFRIMIIYAPISIGELFDKIVILKIKYRHLADEEKKTNVKAELDLLEKLRLEITALDTGDLIDQLALINSEIWDVEDNIREKERKKEFDQDFIQLARSVYFKNDRRAELKRQLNNVYGSGITEEKNYQKYD